MPPRREPVDGLNQQADRPARPVRDADTRQRRPGTATRLLALVLACLVAAGATASTVPSGGPRRTRDQQIRRHARGGGLIGDEDSVVSTRPHPHRRDAALAEKGQRVKTALATWQCGHAPSATAGYLGDGPPRPMRDTELPAGQDPQRRAGSSTSLSTKGKAPCKKPSKRATSRTSSPSTCRSSPT